MHDRRMLRTTASTPICAYFDQAAPVPAPAGPWHRGLRLFSVGTASLHRLYVTLFIRHETRRVFLTHTTNQPATGSPCAAAT